MTSILIVEDESIVAMDLKTALIKLDYKILDMVKTGEEAVEKALELIPDIVLMDITLAGEMDGVEAAKLIKKDSDIPVIYITAFADDQTLTRAKVTEPYGYIIKPFNPREVHSTIEMAIYKHQMELKLKYVSMHDALTGVYNRLYFDEELSRLSDGRADPVGILIYDLDGLKLINDTFGHSKGDELLIDSARVIKNCFRKSDVVARIGGDEFAVLLPKTSDKGLEYAYSRLQDSIKEYNDKNPEIPLNISAGYATNADTLGDISAVLKKAEDNMYQEKLNKSESLHSNIVKIIMRMLEERDVITGKHLTRLDKLVIKFARVLNLSDQDITELRLLAKFHDIGKVGVPDSILFKPASFTPEENKEMCRHSEIGFRIANSLPDLQPVADCILKHHEWWDGSGYPLGLKDEEIPYKCRIIAILDAYDAMRSDRPYRNAMNREQALAELENNAGIQFDPELVSTFINLIINSEDFESFFTDET
jgi:diguanylate cyclase (GGDEF)-like protein